MAVISFSPPETVFEKLFVTGEADIVAELHTRNKSEAPEASVLNKIEQQIEAKTGHTPVGITFDNQLNITIDRQKLLLYNVDYNEVYRLLKTAFKENEVATLRSYQQYLPIALAGEEQTVNEVLQKTLVNTVPDTEGNVRYIPLQSLVRVTPGEDLKTITAGKNGEYIPFSFYDIDNAEQLMENVKKEIDTDWDIDFSGSFFSNRQMLNELVVILFISILLMYFILAAQFESFLQPLIVLLEIPIDVAASLLVLWICGHTMNLMSAIGIVVTCGIIINDSILKLDAINELRKEGVPLMEAIHEAGRRRLRPIIMTSLTTIFGMVPLLFTFDMGSELQKPLSIAMISAMLIGTAVSLFVIPLIYWFIYRKFIYRYVITLLMLACVFGGKAQLTLTLERTITLAADSSLDAFRYKNMYLAGYWEYRTYKAGRLPSLTLNLTPAQYRRYFTQRYDSEADIDVYRKQQSFYAGGQLEIEQNFDLLGGTFYLDTDLDYMRYFGDQTYNQFSSVPIRLGYQQDLLGYNAFKWERKIEPLKYEKVKKELLYNVEQMSEQATTYFFALAMAQVEYDLAKENVATTDTLYRTGQERHKIASISQADLLTLKLDAVNARNTLKNAEIALKRAMFSLASYLNFDKNTEIRLRLPSRPRNMEISVDKALELARANNPTFLELRQQILEAQQQVDKTKKEATFNAQINASVGFNQVSKNIQDAYKNLQQQEIVSLSVSIPLVDWGVRKGKHNIAKNNLLVTETSAKQKELTVEEDVIMTVGDFNIQQALIGSAEEAVDLAETAYSETKQRFMIGKADINSLTLSLNRQQEAQRNYISALQNYWLSYYKIRKLTLHDFETGVSLSNEFEYKYGL